MITSASRTQPVLPFGCTGRSTCHQPAVPPTTSSTLGPPSSVRLDKRTRGAPPPGAENTGTAACTAVAIVLSPWRPAPSARLGSAADGPGPGEVSTTVGPTP